MMDCPEGSFVAKDSGTGFMHGIFKEQLHPFLLVALVGIIYLMSISYPLVYDSKYYLQQSPFVKEFKILEMVRDIPGFVRLYTPLVESPDYVINFVLRPFGYFTFHLNYLAGGFAPEGYRLVNIAIHALTSLLVYGFLKKLLSRVEEDGSRLPAAGIAFCCAALFAVNPMQTEAVTYVVQRFTTLAACLYIASIYLHLLAMDSTNVKMRHALQGASFATLVLGMLTKEFVFTAPIMMVLLNLVVLRKSIGSALRSALLQLCCLPIIPFLLVQTERGDQTPGVDLDDIINSVNFTGMHPFEYLITQFRAILSYFRLVILPYGQSFQHTYHFHTSLLDNEVIISLGVIGLFALAACSLARRRKDAVANLVSYFIIWYFVTISVTSSVIPLSELFVERRVYLPSVGIICGLVLHLARIGKQTSLPALWKHVSAVSFMVVVLSYSTAAISRVTIWSSKLSLWQDVVDKYPCNAIALNDLGYALMKREAYAAAIPYFTRALELGASRKAYQNLGSSYINNGNYREAFRVYLQGLSCFPDNYLLLTGAGAAACLAGEPEKALPYLKRAVAVGSDTRLAAQYYAMAAEKQSNGTGYERQGNN